MKWISTIILLLIILTVAGCSSTNPTTKTTASATQTETPPATASTEPQSGRPSAEPLPNSAVTAVPDFEVELVAKTLRGECYNEQHDDKREVVKVICNRVSMGGFGDSVEAVITAPKQFVGYRPGNIPTANDYEIAREILTEWYEGGCVPLGEYLFFSSGDGHKNAFRKTWK